MASENLYLFSQGAIVLDFLPGYSFQKSGSIPSLFGPLEVENLLGATSILILFLPNPDSGTLIDKIMISD